MAGTAERQRRCDGINCSKSNLLKDKDPFTFTGLGLDAIHSGKPRVQRLCLTTGDIYLREKSQFTRSESGPCIKPKAFDPTNS